MLRDHFAIFERLTFINSCSKGALSHEVRQAYQDYLRDWQELGSPWELWMHKLESCRVLFAELIGANAYEVAVTASVSAAVNALASSLLPVGERDTIILCDVDFPTVAQIWHAQERLGLRVIHIPQRGNHLDMDALAQAINERTLLVAVAHVCYRNGLRQDIKTITELAHAKGAKILVDAYQSLGTMPLNVKELKLDFLVAGALKYLLGSSGLGWLYVAKGSMPALDPAQTGWFAQENIFAMDIYENRPAKDARRFEGGTPPVPNVYAAIAGLKLIKQLGLEKIEAQIQELNHELIQGCLKRGFQVVTPIHPDERGSLIALRSHRVERLVKRLEERGVVGSSRNQNLRLSTHFYNNQQDIAKVLDALSQERELLI
ncbi:MAG: aminotransferase class V-fold PLP-dependent enzyme [Deinococcales bacterium]